MTTGKMSLAILVTVVALLLSACSTPTAVLPTATPISPTSTPNPTPTPAPPTATPKPSTGRIEGRVYRSDTNQSIANATLILLIKSEESGTFAEKIVTVTTTDADGHYSFFAVKPDPYYLWLSLEKIPEYLNYPFCSHSLIPEGWQAYLTGGYPDIPVALIPPNMEFSVAAGDELQKDIDIKVIKCE